MNAWVKKSKAGKTYMSLSFQAKEGQTSQPAPAHEPIPDDDLPFCSPPRLRPTGRRRVSVRWMASPGMERRWPGGVPPAAL